MFEAARGKYKKKGKSESFFSRAWAEERNTKAESRDEDG